MVTAAFHLHNREAKRELKVKNNGKILPLCPVPIYLGVKLDRVLMYRHYLEILRKKLSTRVSLLKRLAGSGRGAGAKILRTAALPLIYSTAVYCAPAWCRSAHTRLIDNVFDYALRIVTGCLHPTPTDNLLVLSSIQPAELRHQGGTLSLANRCSLEPGHILHGQLTEPRAAGKDRLKFRHPFVPAAQKLLQLSSIRHRHCPMDELDMGHRYSKSISVLCVYIRKVSTRPFGMSLTRTAWVKFNRLRTGVGRFGSSMHKWGLASSANCESGARKQTADHIILTYPIHGVPRGIRVCRFWMT